MCACSFVTRALPTVADGRGPLTVIILFNCYLSPTTTTPVLEYLNICRSRALLLGQQSTYHACREYIWLAVHRLCCCGVFFFCTVIVSCLSCHERTRKGKYNALGNKTKLPVVRRELTAAAAAVVAGALHSSRSTREGESDANQSNTNL